MENENNSFSKEMLTLELRDKLMAFNCVISYDVARRQVQEFIDKGASSEGVTSDFYLATHSPAELVESWVEKIVAVSERIDEEISNDYPLLAMTVRDAGILIELISSTLTEVRAFDDDGFMVDAGLRILSALGRQVSLPVLPDSLCLLAQSDTFALTSLISGLREAPSDFLNSGDMWWVESCHEMIQGCFEEIAERYGEGEDLSSPEKRVFVISLAEDDGTSGMSPPSIN